MTKPHIRWMIRNDMEAVLAIEKQCFPFPWDEAEFKRFLRQRNIIGMVAERDGVIVGFMVYELSKIGIDLMSIAVPFSEQGEGIGRLMVEKLAEKLGDRRKNLRTEVDERNTEAQLFFKALGLECVEIVKDAYDSYEGDSYVFKLNLAGARRLLAETTVKSG